MALGPTNPSPAQAHVGLVVYPKQLAVEHAGGDDRHHDAGHLLGLPCLSSLAMQTPTRLPILFPLACGHLLLSASPLPGGPRSSPERALAQPWPTATRSQGTVSVIFVDDVFLPVQDRGVQFLPQPLLASSGSRRRRRRPPSIAPPTRIPSVRRRLLELQGEPLFVFP